MNKFAVAALATVFAAPVYAANCQPNDFSVKNFQIHVRKVGGHSALQLTGELINNCGSPAAAQIQIVAKNAGGQVLEKEVGWPAGSSNIPPGSSVKFNLGALFNYSPDMSAFSAAIISAKTW